MLLSEIVRRVNAKSFGETDYDYFDIQPYFQEAIDSLNSSLDVHRRIADAPTEYAEDVEYSFLQDIYINNYIVTFIVVAMDNASLSVTSRTQTYAAQLEKFKTQTITDLYKWMPVKSTGASMAFDMTGYKDKSVLDTPQVKIWYDESIGGKLSCHGDFAPEKGIKWDNPYGTVVLHPKYREYKLKLGVNQIPYVFIPNDYFKQYYRSTAVWVVVQGYNIEFDPKPQVGEILDIGERDNLDALLLAAWIELKNDNPQRNAVAGSYIDIDGKRSLIILNHKDGLHYYNSDRGSFYLATPVDLGATPVEFNKTDIYATSIEQDIQNLNNAIETLKSNIPTKVSQLSNDADYVTLETLNDWADGINEQIPYGDRTYVRFSHLTANSTIENLYDALGDYNYIFEHNVEYKFYIELGDETILENIHIKAYDEYYDITSIIRNGYDFKIYIGRMWYNNPTPTITEFIVQHRQTVTYKDIEDFVNYETLGDALDGIEEKIPYGDRKYHYSFNLTAANTISELIDELKTYEMFDENNEGKFYIKLSDDTVLENIHIKLYAKYPTRVECCYINSIIRELKYIKVYLNNDIKTSSTMTINELINEHKQIATIQDLADLVDSAPEALNTLSELAEAINNHEDAYDALLEVVGNKVDKTELESYKASMNNIIVAHDNSIKKKADITYVDEKIADYVHERNLIQMLDELSEDDPSRYYLSNKLAEQKYATKEEVPPKTDEGYTWDLDQVDVRRLELKDGGQIFFNWDVDDNDGTVIDYRAFGGTSSYSGKIGFTYEGVPLFTNSHADGGPIIALKDAWSDQPILYNFPSEPDEVSEDGWCDLVSKRYADKKYLSKDSDYINTTQLNAAVSAGIGSVRSDLSNYVTTNTPQTIDGTKRFAGIVGNVQTETGVYLGIDENVGAPNANIAIASANTAAYIDMGPLNKDYGFRIIKWNNLNGKYSAELCYGDDGSGQGVSTITIPRATGTMALTSNIPPIDNSSGVQDIGWTHADQTNPRIATANRIAHWNGAYAGTSSNLKYCEGGVIASEAFVNNAVANAGGGGGSLYKHEMCVIDGEVYIYFNMYLTSPTPVDEDTFKNNLSIYGGSYPCHFTDENAAPDHFVGSLNFYASSASKTLTYRGVSASHDNEQQFYIRNCTGSAFTGLTIEINSIKKL